ncbi:MAG: DNA mismatch repair endonuclease MutL [Thermotaleaceae bacterium]
MSNRIHRLDPLTTNKIAAGEVVDRPASVIKELIENSIDAGASSLVIEVRDAGKDYIRISDNGIGIHAADVEMAFERHATSKISKIEDLDHIYSLGFRGEALASIASVSHLEIITKMETAAMGIQLEMHGSKVINKKEIGCPTGTTIIVKNLFYNTPARYKFMKSNNVESSHIIDLISKLALAHPEVAFKLINNGNIVFSSSGTGNTLYAIASIYGKNHAKNMLYIEKQEEGLGLEAYISKPEMYRGNRQQQVVFVNGRLVKSKIITAAIDEAYHTLLPINKFAICFLYLRIPPQEIDINIHPTKTDIKFTNESFVKKFILSVLREKLLSETLIPQMSLSTKKEEKKEQINFLDRPLISQEFTASKKAHDSFIREAANPYIKETKVEIKENKCIEPIKKEYDNSQEEAYVPDKQVILHPNLLDIKIIGQVFLTYLIGEDLQQMYLIDQHAAHEKILYEKMLRDYKTQKIFSQKLLVPIVLELSPSEFETLKDNQAALEQLGFEIDGFGNNSLLVRSVPLYYGEPLTKGFFMEILEALQKETNVSNHNFRIEKIISAACKEAIKANDKLYKPEMKMLMQQLAALENPFTCPHGRPIIVSMSKNEIERKFKRT